MTVCAEVRLLDYSLSIQEEILVIYEMGYLVMIKMMICTMIVIGKMEKIVFDKMITLVDGKIVLTRMVHMFPCDWMLVLDKVILGVV